MDRWRIEQGDALTRLREWPADCVHCCVTSPPYFGLRSYLSAGHPDKALEVGGEETPAEYVRRLVEVFREVRRVLHPSGCLWLNLGDSYSGSKEVGRNDGGGPGRTLGKTQPQRADRRLAVDCGTKAKDLLGIPWLVAFALRADGWYLRQECPWVKRNPMPESVTDRPGTACEKVFLLSKEPAYYFDMEAVKRTAVDPESYEGRRKRKPDKFASHDPDGKARTSAGFAKLDGETYPERNLRSSDFWFDSVGMLLAGEDPYPELLGLDVTLKPYRGAHFAVMPRGLVEPCVKAGTSDRGCCPACREPWRRVVEKRRQPTRPGEDTKVFNPKDEAKVEMGLISRKTGLHQPGWRKEVGNRDPQRHCTSTQTVGWQAGCDCDAGDPVPCVVCDPFTGAGTVAVVAKDLGRDFAGCELNAEYIKLAQKRLRRTTPPLF